MHQVKTVIQELQEPQVKWDNQANQAMTVNQENQAQTVNKNELFYYNKILTKIEFKSTGKPGQPGYPGKPGEQGARGN